MYTYTPENTDTVSWSLKEFILFAEDAKKNCDAGHSIFRKKMDTILLWLSEYCVPIDVMIQHQPHITALVWGSIRCLISV